MGASPTTHHATRLGRCLVVASAYRGAGHTVLAAHLAVQLAQESRQPVCLLDLDVPGISSTAGEVQEAGGAAHALKLSVTRSVVDLLLALKHAPAPDARAIEEVVVPHPSGVHLLVGAVHPRQSPKLQAELVAPLVHLLKQRYAYVVVDGGIAFSGLLLAACDAAHLILLVSEPVTANSYQTYWVLGMLERLGFPPAMVRLILNRTDRFVMSSPEFSARLPVDVLAQIPSEEPRAAAAMRQLAATLITDESLYPAYRDIPRHHAHPSAVTESIPEGLLGSSRLYAEVHTPPKNLPADEPVASLKRRVHNQLVEQIGLKKLELSVLTNPSQLLELRQRTERVIASLMAREAANVPLPHAIQGHLIREIAEEALGLGPLEELLADADVTDILVNAKDQIYVERRGKLELTTKAFSSDEQIHAVIERIISPLGRHIDEATPMVDARLPDGSRLNAIIPPLSLNGPVLSIRKFSRMRHTHDDLIRLRTLTPAMAQFIRACVVARKNMLISGGAGSGKTTLLNAVSAFIPDGERIITIEDAAELQLAQAHWVSLEARQSSIEGKGQVSIHDLFHNALRMRPDRIIIGECRGAETLDMLQAMNTGHDGSIATVHANSPKDVVSRLDSMVLLSNIDLPIRAIREMVASALNIIIHTARLSDGSRKITAVSEVVDLVNGTDLLLRDLFVFRQTGVAPDGTVIGEFHATGKLPTFFDELTVKGVELSATIFQSDQGQAVLRAELPAHMSDPLWEW